VVSMGCAKVRVVIGERGPESKMFGSFMQGFALVTELALVITSDPPVSGAAEVPRGDCTVGRR
jgi:hypothetical protein